MLKEDLEQRKLFNKKYKITEQAIQKAISFKDIASLCKEDSNLIRDCIKQVLLTSKLDNNHNEVAIAMTNSMIGTTRGTQHGVDINSNPFVRDIISRKDDFVVVMHNHPSTQSFSLQDYSYFLTYSFINVFGIVSNQGQVELLIRPFNLNDTEFYIIEDLLSGYIRTYKKYAKRNGNTAEVLYKSAKYMTKHFREYNYYVKL